MTDKIEAIYRKIKQLEDEFEDALNELGEDLRLRIEEKRTLFEDSVIELHRRMKKPVLIYILEASLLNILVAPVIYSLIVPLALIDLAVTVYQFICFPVYGIRKVPRSDFIVMDRTHLEYLNAVEKLNCAYCGYANGVAAYLREVAARTEKYWCPIKHAKKVKMPHSQYHGFADYGDADGYKALVEKMKSRTKDK